MENEKLKKLMTENELRAKVVIETGVKLATDMLARALSKKTNTEKLDNLAMLRVMAVEILANNIFNAEKDSKQVEIDAIKLEIIERVDGIRKDYASGRVKTRKV